MDINIKIDQIQYSLLNSLRSSNAIYKTQQQKQEPNAQSEESDNCWGSSNIHGMFQSHI